MTRANACTLLAVLLSAHRSHGQTVDASLMADISAVQAAIRSAEEEDRLLSGGLVKSLISLRLATLRQTYALLDQRAKAVAARTTLQYSIDGKLFQPPPDAAAQIAALEHDLEEIAAKLASQESEVARYSGGLVRATATA